MMLERARSMRSQPTAAEQRIWHRLRAHRFKRLKFKRQKPIGHYIVDFVCFEPKPIIEIDGSQHAQPSGYDLERERFLKDRGFTILRYWNDEALAHTDAVPESIRQTVISLGSNAGSQHDPV